MDVLCQSSDESHRKQGFSQLDNVSNLFENNAAGVTNFLFEGHCAMTNADEVHEVQENAVTAKKGEKARHKSNYLVPGKSLLLPIQNSHLC